MAWEQNHAKDHIDLLLRLKEILSGYPLVSMPIRSGIGDGIVVGLHTTEASTTLEQITLTCTDDLQPATFSVTGSSSGAHADATVGVDYSITGLSFRIDEGSVPFSVGDNFVFTIAQNGLSTSTQTWEVVRWLGTGAKTINYLSSTLYDGTGNYTPEKAVDESGSATAWRSDAQLGNGSWWQVEFDKPVWITKVSIGGYVAGFGGESADAAPKDFSIQYSDDGTNWTTDTSFTGETLWQTGEVRDFLLTGAVAGHTFWRVAIATVNSGTQASLPVLNMYDANGFYNVAYYGDGYDAIFRGAGVSGTDNIYVVLRADAYVHNGPNWITSGAVGYSPGLDSLFQASNSKVGFISGSIAYPSHNRLALYDQPMRYLITCTGRFFQVHCRFQNITAPGYFGLFLQYALPIQEQYPYPLFIGASQSAGGNMSITNWGWQRTDDAHCFFGNPSVPSQSVQTVDTLPSPTRVFLPFNEWRQACNKIGTSWSSNNHSLAMFPYQTEEGDTYSDVIDDQLDGAAPMSAICILDRETDSNLGELDGVRHLSGIYAIESLITEAGVDWMVFNNVFRDSYNDYYAVRLQ